MNKSLYILLAIIILLGSSKVTAQTKRSITETELRDKITGFWYGQLAGNFVGFPFENLYQDNPMPIFIDRYYNAGDLDSLNLMMNKDDRRGHTHIMAHALGGAWSDDDTDIEFVTLHAVEKYGLDITYPEITEAWKAHINRFIWAANREARDLMDTGLLPPLTGNKTHNPYWWRITSQLTNEIWSAFYPGMTSLAQSRASWGAHIVCDDWATHATEAYAVMYSAAFFEQDVNRLVQMAVDKLPAESPYRAGMLEVIRWHKENPDDWRKTRQNIHDKFYDEFGGFPIPEGQRFLSAGVNGLCGIMAILYGEGDFVKTVGIATSAGYDNDNQAATCGGLIGVLKGASGIPRYFTHELPSKGEWEIPFNNQYINYSRDGLPNHTLISDIVQRIMNVAEEAILEHGGEKRQVEGEPGYLIQTDF